MEANQQIIKTDSPSYLMLQLQSSFFELGGWSVGNVERRGRRGEEAGKGGLVVELASFPLSALRFPPELKEEEERVPE